MTLAITSTCVGGRYVPHNAASHQLAVAAPPSRATQHHWSDDLTERELQVLCCYMRSGLAKLVASDLGISRRTAEKHLQTIIEKSGLKRTILIALDYDRHVRSA